jgi:XkdW protein
MEVYTCIKYIYPNISDDDFEVQHDGEGDYIKEWKAIEPQPTEEEILAVWKEIEPTRKRPKEGVDLLGEQLVLERIERMKAKQQVDQLGRELVVTKLELMQLKGGTSV